MSCISTLLAIPSKANLVRSFEFIYIGSTPFFQSNLIQLSESLQAMLSLKHLKLNFPWANERDIPPLLIPCLEYVSLHVR